MGLLTFLSTTHYPLSTVFQIPQQPLQRLLIRVVFSPIAKLSDMPRPPDVGRPRLRRLHHGLVHSDRFLDPPGAPPLSRSDRAGHAVRGHPLSPNPRHFSPTLWDGRR